MWPPTVPMHRTSKQSSAMVIAIPVLFPSTLDMILIHGKIMHSTDSCKALTFFFSSIYIYFLTLPGALHSHCDKPTKSAPIFFKTISGRKCLFVQLVPIWHWYLVLVKPRFFHLQKSKCVLVIDQWSSFMSRVS